MQGGRQEIGVSEIGARGSPRDLPTRRDEIQISPAVDAFVKKLRQVFLSAVALPMCWIYMYPDRASFRAQKTRQIREGVATVLAVQKRLRHKFLDYYFQAWSFCAEEEFYLIVIPLLVWNHDLVYARHITFVVCTGLVVGNLYKDAFELPRPTAVSTEVWSPKSQAQIDSTACKDFGFPSTHSMNAISNTVFTLLYFYFGNKAASDVPFPFPAAVACTGVWWVSLILGRLYLGVHSLTDIRGGIALGAVLAAGWHRVWPTVEALLLNPTNTGLLTSPPVLTASALALLLILHPQPTPQTPTFLQNALLAGLLSGLVHGTWQLGQSSVPLTPGTRSYFLRIVFGYVVVLAGRGVLKTVVQKTLYRLFGIDARAGAGKSPMNKETGTEGGDRGQVRAWDLFAAALTKFVVYHWISWMITCGMWPCFRAVGLVQ